MLRRRTQLGFPRKVVAYYLLFCMVAVCWLAVGVLATSHTVLSSRTINASLARLGKTAAALEIEYLRHGTLNFPKILDQTKAEAGLEYASVVASEGKFLAHTEPQLVGTVAPEPTGSHLRWGDVSGVRLIDPSGHVLRQYQVPLVVSGVPFGSLRIAVAEPSLWGTIADTAHIAPFAILVPIALVGVGAIVLSRLTSPVASVDQQLRQLALAPTGAELTITPLPARNATTLGWNRLADLVENLRRNTDGNDLETRLAKAASSRKHSELSTILQSMSDGIAVTDMEGRITFANRAISVLLGEDQALESLQGAEFQDRLLEEMPNLSTSVLFDPQSVHHSVVTESEPQGDNNGRVLRIARQPLQGEQQSGQIWTLRDVTQQKLAEKMRDQFIDTATHELRTPLSNIKAYAETLATCEKIDVEEQKEFCNIINSETTRLARFVDDLLSISSMEVGSLSADRQKVETARLFAEVEAKVLPLMQQKNIIFESRLPEKLPDLQLDKEKMVAVLVNLLGNAAKYTPNGGHVSLKVKVEQRQLQIAIEDTGVG
ncbi:MAG: PAS domain-containing protein, partial [Planctomycetales bacterium]|nr:PAS domain-containing protein [Planctomycetales bacterium]